MMKKVLYINWHNSLHYRRRHEFKKCLSINKAVFDEIINLSDTPVDGTTFVPFVGRPAFNDFFKIMTKGDLSVIANLDIYFDETLTAKIPNDNQCFALTRWDINKGVATFYNHADSQDAWCFTNPPKYVNGGDICMGKAGVDNSIAHYLAESGYEVLNPSLTIKTYHLHETPYRTYIQKGQVIDRIPPPYKLLTPTA